VVKKENGYAMVIALIVLTVLFLFSTALTVLINGEVSISSNNFNRIKAKYNAEAGIEEGIYILKSNKSSLEPPNEEYPPYPKNIEWDEWDQGVYEFNIYPPENAENETNWYKISSNGYYRDKEGRKINITAFVDGSSNNESFIYNNQFTINRIDDISDEYGNGLSDLDENSDKLFENLIENDGIYDYFDDEPPFNNINPNDLYRKFIAKYYSEYDVEKVDGVIDNNIGEYYPDLYGYFGDLYIPEYNDTKEYTIDKKNIIVDESENLFTFDPNYIYHYRGNLTFSGSNPQQSDLDSELNLVVDDLDDYEYVPTPLIVVDGDLKFNKIKAVRNFIFIVKGDIFYDSTASANDSTIDRTLIYSEGDFNYYRVYGNNEKTSTPHIKFNGQIITEGNINLKLSSGNSAVNNKNITWPSTFSPDYFGDLTESSYEIKKWIE